MHQNKLPQIGKKYLIRRFPCSKDDDLYLVTVTGIAVLGDATTIIRYKNGRFGHIQDLNLKDFIKNSDMKER